MYRDRRSHYLLPTHLRIIPNHHLLLPHLPVISNHCLMLPMSWIPFRMKSLNSSGRVPTNAILSLSPNAQRTPAAYTIEDAYTFQTLMNSACTFFARHTTPQQRGTQYGLRHWNS